MTSTEKLIFEVDILEKIYYLGSKVIVETGAIERYC